MLADFHPSVCKALEAHPASTGIPTQEQEDALLSNQVQALGERKSNDAQNAIDTATVPGFSVVSKEIWLIPFSLKTVIFSFYALILVFIILSPLYYPSFFFSFLFFQLRSFLDGGVYRPGESVRAPASLLFSITHLKSCSGTLTYGWIGIWKWSPVAQLAVVYQYQFLLLTLRYSGESCHGCHMLLCKLLGSP